MKGFGKVEDHLIIDLYFARDERALGQTAIKYGTYLTSIARRIVNDSLDADECVNDAYLGTWNAIPPTRPNNLKTFVAKITRNLSLKRYRKNSAAKRGSSEVIVSLSELEECVSGPDTIDNNFNAKETAAIIDGFLSQISQDDRIIFVRRYWFFDSVADIANAYGFGESKVKMSLKRTRDRLATYLIERGVEL